jgi:hypothetical protein
MPIENFILTTWSFAELTIGHLNFTSGQVFRKFDPEVVNDFPFWNRLLGESEQKMAIIKNLLPIIEYSDHATFIRCLHAR